MTRAERSDLPGRATSRLREPTLHGLYEGRRLALCTCGAAFANSKIRPRHRELCDGTWIRWTAYCKEFPETAQKLVAAYGDEDQ